MSKNTQYDEQMERFEPGIKYSAGEPIAWMYLDPEGDYVEHAAVASLEAENQRFRSALELLSEGDTPWMDGYHKEAWEVMAAFAKQTLLGGGDENT